MKHEKEVRDVVCGMTVEADRFVFEYQGSSYAFCSAQCRERFAANPHLYVGRPGQPAPKQLGQTVFKRRRFHLDRALDPDQAQTLRAEVGALMGVESIEVEGAELTVTYDLLQATAEQIERTLEVAGAQLGGGWAEHLKRGFTHYTEECEIGNLQVGPPSGCH